MLVPYPPGIPVRMPGERLGGPDSPTIKLILALEEFGKRFPGFEREVHGIETDTHGDYWVRTVLDPQHGDSRGSAPGAIRGLTDTARNRRRLRLRSKNAGGH